MPGLKPLLLMALFVAPAAFVALGTRAASRNNETVALSVGASLAIVLSENPSTGYRWQIDPAQSTNLAIVRVVDAGYQAATNGLIGAPGSHHWRIETQAPGKATITFVYLRPWQPATPGAMHVVDVVVTGLR